MTYTILLHTHSSYSYLWPIINDYIKKYNFKKILAYDIVPENIQLPNNFDKYIKYNSSENFSKRLVNILNEITEEYVFIIYDVDIIINIDEKLLNYYIEIMIDNNIDRMSSVVYNGNGVIYKNGIGACNLNLPLNSPSNHFIPIDCTPAIWNRKSFIKMLFTFPNESYRSLELNNDVINYCKTKLKCYGIQYTPNLKILYNRGLTHCDKISFLHITTQGKFLIPFSVYCDYEINLKNIIEKYNLNINKIGFNKAGNTCINFNRL